MSSVTIHKSISVYEREVICSDYSSLFFLSECGRKRSSMHKVEWMVWEAKLFRENMYDFRETGAQVGRSLEV